MDNLINEKRTEQIIKFLNSLDIKSKRFIEIINKTGLAGVEPTTYGLGNRCSILLSYSPNRWFLGY